MLKKLSIATMSNSWISTLLAVGVSLGVFASPGNATVLSLGDDDFEQVSLGFDFDCFGITNSDVFVRSNGYLTLA